MGTALPKKSESTGDFVVPDPGVYLMELTDVGEAEVSQYKKKDGTDNWRIQLTFRICDGDEFDGVEIRQWYGLSMHESSYLYPIICALNGGSEPDDADDTEIEDFLGKRIMATTKNVIKPRKDNPSETVTFANIVAAAPVKKKKATKIESNGRGNDIAEAKRQRARDLARDNDADDTWDDDE